MDGAGPKKRFEDLTQGFQRTTSSVDVLAGMVVSAYGKAPAGSGEDDRSAMLRAMMAGHPEVVAALAGLVNVAPPETSAPAAPMPGGVPNGQ